ncbi:NRDE family protein [Hyphobacterium sp. CCMP332]|nr:NRDE family protein [Hyphobacterium sp. CCMP332]
MCLVVFSYRENGSFLLAGNRDEFYNRETKKAEFWDDIPGLIAGRDLKAGGTWLGLDQYGNIAVLTNYRHPKYFKEAEKSRGELITEFFKNPNAIDAFSNNLKKNSEHYNGYNLIFGNPRNKILYFSNVSAELAEIKFGIHGLSNAFLNTPWPKVENTKERFEIEVKADYNETSSEKIFSILNDTKEAPTEKLPDTGVDIDLEKKLSSPFIKMEGYGTRCSTIISISEIGNIEFTERSYENDTDKFIDTSFSFFL